MEEIYAMSLNDLDYLIYGRYRTDSVTPCYIYAGAMQSRGPAEGEGGTGESSTWLLKGDCEISDSIRDVHVYIDCGYGYRHVRIDV